MMVMERLFYIDFMRFLALLCIIIAHVSPPDYIFQIRNFDVSLMVFVAGLSFSTSLQKKTKESYSYFKYVLARIKRLVFPVWIFLTCYFVIGSIWNEYTFDKIITSYFMISGIGYVWFIRILLVFSVIGPLILLLEKRWGRVLIMIIFFASFAFNSLFYSLYGSLRIIDLAIFDWLGYLPIYILGVYINRINAKVVLFTLLTCILYFLVCFFVLNENVVFQEHKYPAKGAFIIYGVMTTLTLFSIRNYITKLKEMTDNAVFFVSNNSIWIYLFHIIMVEVFLNSFENWFMRFGVVLLTSIALVYVKNFLVHCYVKNIGHGNWFTVALKG